MSFVHKVVGHRVFRSPTTNSRVDRTRHSLNTLNKRKVMAILIFIVSCFPVVGGLLMLKKMWRVVIA